MSNAINAIEKILETEDPKSLTFVETGSFQGDTIQLALDKGFKKVISIEQSEHYINHCAQRFKGKINDSVVLVRGDSKNALRYICKDLIEGRSVFWLDAHYDGGLTAGDVWAPLYHELLAIACFTSVNDNIIMIDDIRHVRDGHYRVDLQCVEFLIGSINSEYQISYEEGHQEKDVLLAMVKK